MPKKRSAPRKKKSVLNMYMDEFLSLLLPRLAGETDRILKGIADASRIRKKIQIYVTSMIIFVAALTVLFYGLGATLGDYLRWPAGFGHVVIGLFFIIIAYLYKNSK